MNAQSLGHIYLVDDDISIRRALSGTLERLGYTVTTYENPDHFLRDAIPVSPSAILMDMRMPGKSGVEIQSELIKHKWLTPVIFISGESLPAQIIQAMKQGAIDFLLKPFSMESLLRSIGTALEKDHDLHIALQKRMTIQERYVLLTPREKVICAEIVSGRSNKEIAEASGSAAATVKLHRARVLSKMRVKSAGDLIGLFENINISELEG